MATQNEHRAAQDLLALSIREMVWALESGVIGKGHAQRLRIANDALILADEIDRARIGALSEQVKILEQLTK
mgnify:CR=1 FL=1|jgi:hypothetical protein|tara:strand:- start:437 stop:652 length:216 start_codon:yes stop_codon:yes gene_type:complete